VADTSSVVPGDDVKQASSTQQSAVSAVFLNMLSWSNEGEQQYFYRDATHQAVHRFISNIGTLQLFSLEPM
jgi:hypothetical protein